MAAINSNVGGGHTFDPSKRIRASLGDEFVASVETEAIERLAEAMATNAKKSDGNIEEYVEENNDMGGIRSMFNNIKHTTPKADELKAANTERVEQKLQQFENTPESPITTKPTMFENVVRATTGLGIKDSKKHNLAQITSNAIRAAGSFVTTDAMETTFRFNRYRDDKIKNVGIAAGVSSAIDFAATYLGSANIDRVTKLITDTGVYDYSYLTMEDMATIKKVANKEKLIYAAEHVAASVVVPTVTKLLLSKFVGDDKLESSTLLKSATSFGALSTASKLGLTAIRNVVANKTTPNHPTDLTAMAKVAAKVTINEQLDPTLVGTIAGSIVGYNSVEFENPTKSKLQEFKDKAIPVAGETFVIPVEDSVAKSEPTAKAETEVKTTKSKTTKVA